QAGPVIKVKIPKDRDGKPKQFAFVNFKHEESVPYGLSLLNGIKLFGRPIKIQFRSGSSHASQDGNPSCSPHGAASTSPLGAPHPATICSRYEPWGHILCVLGGTAASQAPLPSPVCCLSLGNNAGWQQPPFGGKYEQLPFPPPGYAPHGFHGAPQVPRRPELPRKGRPGAHPYHPEGRHLGRERFGERGPDYGRGTREEHSHEERGREGEHHYRGGREEPPYADRHQDGWSHDYDYRREGYREAKWPPSRH
ncbi:RBM7 protein, partial [Rostratula benghalensis]|nr:RBM7 protein [Rostratula benghalensis]